MKFLFSLSCSIGLLACTGEIGDPTLYLTGTEEFAIQTADGQYVCEAPKKVLICHIPPGNPDNAHTICVSTNAVETHQSHHGDTVGPCDGDGGGDDVDAPPPPPPPEDGGTGGGDDGGVSVPIS